MDSVQVFNWFCKEQKIIDFVRTLFYLAKPKKIHFNGKNMEYKPLSYTEYISDKIENNGFDNIFFSMVNDCRWNFSYGAYDEHRKMMENFDKKACEIYKKWNYFIKNCVKVDENSFLREGNVIKSACLGNNLNLKISSIDIPNCNLSGNEVSNGRNIWIPFSYIREDEKIKFYIKRKRRIYNGSNSK